MAADRDHASRLRRRLRRRRDLEHSLETEYVNHVGGDSHRARLVDAARAEAFDETLQHAELTHARPGQRRRGEQLLCELADRGAVAARAIDQGLGVARRVDRLLWW